MCARPLTIVRTTIAASIVFGAVSLAAPAFASTDFVIEPYLQHLSATRVQVRFQADEEAGAVVELKPPTGQARRYQDAAATEFHDVTVDGLEPATTYSYTVRVGDKTSAPASFTTAPSSSSHPFSFLIAGDNRDDPDQYADLVQLMLRVPSAFVVHTGDLVPRGKDRDAWEEYFRIAQPLLSQRCEFVAIGNHDFSGKGAQRREPFLQFFASPDDPQATYFTFRWGNSRFFVLDTKETWEADQGPWFRERLESADHEEGIAHRIVVLHHSPFSTGKHGPNREMTQAGILHMMLEHRVDLVIGGHDHMYERGQFGGIKYIISGGAGAPLYDVAARGSATAFSASRYHFVEVQVDGDRVHAVARGTKGEVFDSAVYEGSGSWALAPAPGPVAAPLGQHGNTLPALPPLPPRRSSCGCSAPRSDAGSLAAPLFGAVIALALLRRPGRRRRASSAE